MKLCFPENILRQHVAVLGKTGKGKSSSLRHIVEHLLKGGKRVCVIDPKGDWWGLKFAADGAGEGCRVICFGDFMDAKASDVPINEHSGRHVAQLIAEGNRPCIIGFRGWMPGKMVRFWIDFASALFQLNAGELYLVGDEFHNFAPKGKIMDPDAGKCLHWSNRLMSEGRGLGLVCLIASQRPQKVHNDTLTCCETLIALGVNHKADRTAIQEWIEGCGDMAKGKEVLNSLAGLARGEAFVWSPEIGFGPERLVFPMFETFDSFAPPQLQKKIQRQDWSTVSLDDVKAKMATVIEEAKANDPAHLKSEVRRLTAELKKAGNHPALAAPEIKEVPVFTAEERTMIERSENLSGELLDKIAANATQIMEAMVECKKSRAVVSDKFLRVKDINGGVGGILYPAGYGKSTAPGDRHQSGVHAHPPVTAPRSPENTGREVALAGGMKRMLAAIRQRPGLSKRQLGVRAGLSSVGGTFGTYLSKLRSSGWVYEQNGGFWLTEAGANNMGTFDPLPEGEALQQYWLGELGQSGAARMLEALLRSYPLGMTKEELGSAAQITHSAGTFGTYLSKLRALELVVGKSQLTASEELFS